MNRQKGAQFQNSRENLSIVDCCILSFQCRKDHDQISFTHDRLARGAIKCHKTTATMNKSMH